MLNITIGNIMRKKNYNKVIPVLLLVIFSGFFFMQNANAITTVSSLKEQIKDNTDPKDYVCMNVDQSFV